MEPLLVPTWTPFLLRGLGKWMTSLKKVSDIILTLRPHSLQQPNGEKQFHFSFTHNRRTKMECLSESSEAYSSWAEWNSRKDSH